MGKGTLTLAPDAPAVLQSYHWPGNVRELRNLMERAAVLGTGPQIDGNMVRLLLPPAQAQLAATEETPEPTADNLQLEPAVEELERKLILRALGVANDNKAEAARLLGVSERTLWYKLKRYVL
jgi:two-component system response regulator AtoC